MAKEQKNARQIARKYRRLRRQTRRETVTYRLIPVCAAVILTVLACVICAVYFSRRKPPLPKEGELAVYTIDVGQGDAVILLSEGHAALIDAGEYAQSAAVLRLLRQLDIQRLDFAVNTHPHADHAGGMAYVLRTMPAGSLEMPDMPEALLPTTASFTNLLDTAQAQQIPLHCPACHEKKQLGAAEIEFLCTDNSRFDDLNNCSLAVRVTCGKHSFFLGGDMEQEAEAAFLAEGLVQPATVYKVSHHGSSSSSSQAFLAALRPSFAVISCGAGNDYGHPSDACIRRLKDTGCTIFRTDYDGTVLFLTNGETLSYAVRLSL